MKLVEKNLDLEETKNSGNVLQNVNNVLKRISRINTIQDSDNNLAEKITQILNIYENEPFLKANIP